MSHRYVNCKDDKNAYDFNIDSCELIETGTFKNFIGWEKIDGNNIPKGEVRIALITDVNVRDYIDGIWTIAGKKVSEHASWTEASLLSGLYAGYTFNESSGSTASDVLGNYDATLYNMEDADWSSSSVSGNALNFDGTDEFVNTTITSITNNDEFSVSFWFNATSETNFDIMSSINSGGLP